MIGSKKEFNIKSFELKESILKPEGPFYNTIKNFYLS